MTKSKLRTIVCGSTFGQFYIEALKKLPEEFELVGILSQGSERSVKCAEYYGIKLYKDINEIPEDIDLACVVLRSGVLGGKGTDITLELLKKGINVIQEQPVHHKDMANCFRVARENNVAFMVGNLYTNLNTIKEFIAGVKAIVENQKIIYVDGCFASQVSYPMMAILMESLPSIRSLKILDVVKNGGPFHGMAGTIGGIPFNFRVHNEVNPDDPDNYLHLLHRIEIGCEGGSLALTDTHGPVIWHPRLHVPKDSVSLNDYFKVESLSLSENSSENLSLEKNISYREIFTREWPKAIGEDLLKIKAMIIGEENVSMYSQRELLCSTQWHEMTKTLGYPEIKVHSYHNPLSVEVLKNSISKVRKKTTKIFPYGIKTDLASCKECAESELRGVNKECVKGYIKNLDKAVFSSMIYTLQLNNIFKDKLKRYSISEILTCSNTSAQHHNLIIRWLELLEDNGYITKDGEFYYGADIITKEIVMNHWNEVKKVWSKGMGSNETIDYFIDNVNQLPKLMSGEQQAVFLLFPEGKIDCAYTMYHDMVTVRYLNKLVSEAVIRIAAQNKLSSKCDKESSTINIIEIGAGTGATTDIVVPRLKEIENIIDIKYLFTDISKYFLSSAREKFNSVKWMDFSVIDIGKDFIHQGLKEKSADIIIAAGVINNAADTDSVIKGLLNLLVPGGWLLITEAVHECREMLISQAFMMTSPSDDRENTKTTFMSMEQWEEVFKNAGAKEVIILPEDDHVLTPLGQKFFAVKK